MAAPTYRYDIQSIHESDPGTPNVVTIPLDVGLQAGDPIDPQDLTHARAVADAVKAAHATGQDPLITPGVVRRADLRAKAVEAAHYAAYYAPADIMQILGQINDTMAAMEARILTRVENGMTGMENRMTNRMDNLTTRLDIITAQNNNTRIRHRNARVVTMPGQVYEPLQKTVPGHGLQLALNLSPPNHNNQQLVAPNQTPPIGSTPESFHFAPSACRHHDILQLIAFYNEDFSIVIGDSLSDRVNKFSLFLCTL